MLETLGREKLFLLPGFCDGGKVSLKLLMAIFPLLRESITKKWSQHTGEKSWEKKMEEPMTSLKALDLTAPETERYF